MTFKLCGAGAVEFDDLQHSRGVGRLWRVGHIAVAGIVIGWEGAFSGSHFRADGVGMSGHECSDGGGVGAPLITIVAKAAAHDQGSEVCIAKAKGAEGVGVFRD